MLKVLSTSIVFRSAAIVLSIATLVGALFTGIAYYWSNSTDQIHARQRMQWLVGTVENTTSSACYLRDIPLAEEIARGLLSNDDLLRVRIFSEKMVITDMSKEKGSIVDSKARPLPNSKTSLIRDVNATFDNRQRVCQIMLEPNTHFISAEAKSRARLLIYLLIAQAIVMAAAVMYVVLRNITRPIKTISDHLHKLSPTTGARLELPQGNENDEIGQLVQDVNTLISSLIKTLEGERKMRIKHSVGEKKFKAIFDNSETGIILIKSTGELLSHNKAFLRLIGANDLALSHVNTAFSIALEGQQVRLYLMLDDANRLCTVQSEDFCIAINNDQKRWLNIVISAIDDGVLQGVINDITERKHGEDEANQLAVTDHLTNAHNRLGFDREMSRIAKEIGRGKKHEFFLLLIDLDYFKAVNDAYGHEAGDKVLVHVTNILVNTLRKSDFIARIGGDEFIVLLKDLNTAAKAEEITQKILDQLSLPITIGINTTVKIGASIGMTYSDGQNFDKDLLLRQADEAMYDVKNQGKMGYRLYQAA
jgi:diguanylate cyclase (GGDEF)-like protein/PAS domain S-box-containing protein